LSNKIVLISTHAVFDEAGEPRHGTGSELATYLQRKKQPYYYIKHALYGEDKTEVEVFKNNRVKKYKIGIKKLPLPLRMVQDQLINFYYLVVTSNIGVYIGVDPLNAFTGILGKKIKRTEKVIFYTADYAHNRFDSLFLNRIYHFLDRISVRYANQVWNVSSRIVDIRKKQGLDQKKNFLVPNTPEFAKTKRLPLSKIHKHDLVIVSNLTKAIDYPLMFRAVSRLKSKYKDIRLKIIGSGEHQKYLEKFVEDLKLDDHVIFMGRKPHEQVLEILSQSAVGVAIYTRDHPWTEFGDSMKVREYLACGLPIIMNDVAATAEDISRYDAGVVLKGKAYGFEKAVDELFSDKEKYAAYRKNAIRLAKKYDFTKVVDQAFAKIA